MDDPIERVHRAPMEAPVVVSAQATRLGQVLDAARNGGAALTIIDTVPHSEAPRSLLSVPPTWC